MKLRIMGLPAEAKQAIALLAGIPEFDLIEVSGPYPNRGASRQVRVYADIQFTEWCDRTRHDGDCCPGARKEWATRPQIPPQRKEIQP